MFYVQNCMEWSDSHNTFKDLCTSCMRGDIWMLGFAASGGIFLYLARVEDGGVGLDEGALGILIVFEHLRSRHPRLHLYTTYPP